MKKEDIYRELDNLAEQISIIDSNLKFNITILLALLTLVVALAGWALTILTKHWVHKSIDSKIRELKVSIKSTVLNEIKSQTYIRSFISYSKDTGHIFRFERLSDGSEPLIIIDDKATDKNFEVTIKGNKIMIIKMGNALNYTILITNCKNIEWNASGKRDILESRLERET